MSVDVNRKYGLRPRGDEGLQEGGIHVPGVWFRVHRDNHAALQHYSIARRDVRACADQHLVTGLDADRRHCEVQRGRPAADGHAVSALAVLGESPFEVGDETTGGARNHTLSNGLCRERQLALSDHRLVHRDHDRGEISTLSFSAPRNGPCFTLTHWKSSSPRKECAPSINSTASPGEATTSTTFRP